ncbi:hypothetical protein IAR55_007070 [Kwoniella newhampshirensis]|uniref:Oxidation resistance protein 1 n=1 Tax=Kwoniella newhampshirensis TaxID=1651941 RepID=A0AAW0YS87_9TREE
MLSPNKRYNDTSSSGSAQPLAPASHASSSSSDFGAFTSADHIQRQPPTLHETDLLGSFDDPHPASERRRSPRTAFADVDLLGGDDWVNRSRQPHNVSQLPDLLSSPSHDPAPPTASSPIHVDLPPRPTDIAPDYVPPIRSPRRLSTNYFASSLSSPPLVTDAGSDIIFHPSHESGRDSAVGEMRRVQRTNSRNSTLSSVPISAHDIHVEANQQRTFTHSPPHGKLLDTLATTTKLASKWRSVLNHSTFVPPGHALNEQQFNHPQTTLAEPIPIDVTHDTPFASADQIAGSYTAPAGAPGFDPREARVKGPQRGEEEWGHIRLSGRRETTDQVLKVADADSLRQHLPPRQRLASIWTLLFSLDQHGASLSTLYRLVDKYAQSHPTSGNVLVVRDGKGGRFGVFMNEAIVKREGTYYGSGESFLFKLSPTSQARSFKWTGQNQYFALCESGFVSFGGGAGVYGLLLDSTFTHNSSATCPAYNNEILCESGSRVSNQAVPFECLGLEVWGT